MRLLRAGSPAFFVSSVAPAFYWLQSRGQSMSHSIHGFVVMAAGV